MNITMDMVLGFVAVLGLIATVLGFVIAKSARTDDRIGAVAADLADHKVKSAESFVIMSVLAAFEERMVRMEERWLAEFRAMRSDIAQFLASRSRKEGGE